MFSAIQKYYYTEDQIFNQSLTLAVQEVKKQNEQITLETIPELVAELLSSKSQLTHPVIFKDLFSRKITSLTLDQIESTLPELSREYIKQSDLAAKEEQSKIDQMKKEALEIESIANNQKDLQAINEGIIEAINDASYFAYLTILAYCNLEVGYTLPANTKVVYPEYEVEAILTGAKGLRAVFLKPLSPNGPPVMVIRGTVPDSFDNLRDIFISRTIGKEAFDSNVDQIFDQMESMYNTHKQKLVIAGHSMGGAISQLTAIQFSTLVHSIYLLNSPGVHAYQFLEKFYALDDNLRPKVYDYHHANDIPHKSGGESLPATDAIIVGHSQDKISYREAHQIFQLAKSLNCTTIIKRDNAFKLMERPQYKQILVDKVFEGGRYYILGSIMSVYFKACTYLYGSTETSP